ncbi:MAG: hypothetical protein AAGA23_05160 [Pseudomonadota bacterium]
MRIMEFIGLGFFATWLAATPLGTGFSYQGQLARDGDAISGPYDFEFLLYNQVDGGEPVADPVLLDRVPVEDGLFSVELDFGMTPFGGDQLWIEVWVRESDGVEDPVALTPRQPLTPAPFALFSRFVEIDSVTGSEIADGTVTASDLAASAVGAAQVNASQVQLRLNDGCTAGAMIQSVGSDGSVTCAADQDTTYAAGQGLRLNGTEFAVDTETTQARVTETCSVGMVLSGINADGGVICTLLPVGRTRWVTSGGYTSIAVRDGDLPILSVSGFGLSVYACSNPACSSGRRYRVDDASGVGQYNAIALRADGNPIVSYYDAGNEALKIFDCDDPDCATGTARIVDQNNFNVGLYTDMAVGPDNLPVISYLQEESFGFTSLKLLKCNDPDCAGNDETINTIESSAFTGRYSSVAVPPDGLPVISYYDSAAGALKIAKCDDPACDGGGETITVIDNSSAVTGQFTSIALGWLNLPIVSYFDETNSRLMTAYCSTADCTEFETDSVADAYRFGEPTSIAVRRSGRAVIAYQSDDGNLEVFDCFNVACSTGVVRALDSDGFVGQLASIALRSDDTPVTSYRNGNNGVILVYSCGDSRCQN